MQLYWFYFYFLEKSEKRQSKNLICIYVIRPNYKNMYIFMVECKKYIAS